jgi:putative salt-induced outer membrane protein YdiY
MRGWAFFAAAVTLAAGIASADEVILKDGSRLVGQVERLADGKLKIKTDFAGELTIDAAKVQGLTTEKPVNVQLTGGEVPVGTLSYTAAGQKVLAAGLPERTIDVGQVTGLWQPGTDSPEVAAAKQKAEDAKPKWSLRLEAGLDGATGNSERFGLLGRAEGRMTTESERLLLYLQERYAQENGTETVNNVLGGARLEVDFTKAWYGYGRVELEHDSMADLDIRLTAAAGAGYFVIRKPNHEFKVFAGAGYEHSSFASGLKKDLAIIELGETYRLEVTPWLLFVHGITYNPAIEDFGDFRVVMENAAEIPLTSDKSWKFKAGVRNQYVSQPDPGRDRLDTFYFANIVVDLK